MKDIVFRACYLGIAPYTMVLRLQQSLVKWMRSDHHSSIPTLLLLQHNPVYTVGYRDKQYTSEEQRYLQSLGADFVRTNRGGLITFHGPGQLVVYPVFSMRRVPISVRNYLCKLEQVAIDVCGRFGVEGTRSPHTGVWIGDRKICAMGVNAQQRVFSHGIALNCNVDLSWFSHIVPCGIEGKGVTSITKETGTEVTVRDVLPIFMENFSTTFGWKFSKLNEIYTSSDTNFEMLFKSVLNSEDSSQIQSN